MPAPAHTPHSDSHVHTTLCAHAVGSMEEYVLAAIARGLEELVFLEHMEEGIDSPRKTWLSEEDFDLYFAEGQRLQRLYGKKLRIGLGVECGYNSASRQTLLTRLAARKWTQIGISCHFLLLQEGAGHLNLFSRHPENIAIAREFGIDHVLEAYFATLTEAVQTLPGSKVCHLDGALRFLPDVRLTNHHYAQIEHLLKEMAARGIALEVNTSGLTIRGEQFPCRRILEMAKGINLDLVFGSDAHRPEDVAGHFPEILSRLP